MSSKIIGAESEFFSSIVVDAVEAVRTVKPNGKVKFPVKSINILKSHGKSARESQVVQGFALNCVKASQQMPSYISNAKIAILDINLQKHRFCE